MLLTCNESKYFSKILVEVINVWDYDLPSICINYLLILGNYSLQQKHMGAKQLAHKVKSFKPTLQLQPQAQSIFYNFNLQNYQYNY